MQTLFCEISAVFRFRSTGDCGAAEVSKGRKRVEKFSRICFFLNSAVITVLRYARWATRESVRRCCEVTKQYRGHYVNCICMIY